VLFVNTGMTDRINISNIRYTIYGIMSLMYVNIVLRNSWKPKELVAVKITKVNFKKVR